MSFHSALTTLANLSVAGVAHNYAIEALPTSLTRAHLPCLLVLPIDTHQDRFFKDAGGGFVVSAFSNGLKTVTFTTTHLLVVSPVANKTSLHSRLPALIDTVDAYFATLALDPLLANTLVQPAQVRVEVGVFPYGDTPYYGCAFRHEWLIAVA